jgi:hypothetical protein
MEMRDMLGKCFASGFVLRTAAIFSRLFQDDSGSYRSYGFDWKKPLAKAPSTKIWSPLFSGAA